MHLVFACHVSGWQQLVLPPLVLDVLTMLACWQLAQVLANAYANPNKPLVLMDSGGCIILWYPPDAISPWIQVRLCIVTYGPTFTLTQQAKMEEATVGMGYLKKSMTSSQETKWRTFSGYFHMNDHCPLTPGCINIAPYWFQQDQEG
ncbi:hypothetical protein DFH29DRAFT_881200 [Suillus ampliporus]|nr:hypothetical protein DFH29DRAFT_881200 [Suillus ampliporus]